MVLPDDLRRLLRRVRFTLSLSIIRLLWRNIAEVAFFAIFIFSGFSTRLFTNDIFKIGRAHV